jgi:hypothetical protein
MVSTSRIWVAAIRVLRTWSVCDALLEVLNILLVVGWDWVPRYLFKSLGTTATSGLLYKPQMTDEDDFWSNRWNEDWQGKPKYSEKTCPSATLSTTKSHMTRPGFEPRTAAVGSQRLNAWAMARPYDKHTKFHKDRFRGSNTGGG